MQRLILSQPPSPELAQLLIDAYFAELAEAEREVDAKDAACPRVENLVPAGDEKNRQKR